MNEDLRILVVDDKDFSRHLISGIVADISGAEVVDTAANGRIALAKLRQFSIDMVLLTLDIPEMGNLEVIKKIRDGYHDTDVVIVSDSSEGRVDEIVSALERGAMDFVPRPVDVNVHTIREFRLRLLTIIGLLWSRRNFRLATHPMSQSIIMGAGPVIGTKEVSPKFSASPVPERGKQKLSPVIFPARIDVVAIAVSTGGPNALAKVIPRLPVNLRVPILIVQHMPHSFTASLASSLNKKSAIKVQEAFDGEEVLPNTAYLAPGGRHMIVRAETTVDRSAKAYLSE